MIPLVRMRAHLSANFFIALRLPLLELQLRSSGEDGRKAGNMRDLVRFAGIFYPLAR